MAARGIFALKKMDGGIITIIFSESFGASLLVFLGLYFLTYNLVKALIFGVIVSAPVGTAIVLQEYRARSFD